MSAFKIIGGRKLHGDFKVQGAKNSVLPLLAACFLCDGQSILHNCPNLSDVTAALDILECLGCRCKREGTTVTVDSQNCDMFEVPECLMREMRSSIIFMGAVAARTGRALMSLPGGCELGPRPIDIHIEALKRMGAVIECESGKLICEFPEGIRAADLYLRFPSVGATENAMIAASVAKGTTVIRNAAKEPEIVDLAYFLNKAGACVQGAGTDTVTVVGVEKLYGCEHTVMSDRIVAATCMYAVAAVGGRVRLKGVDTEYLLPMISTLTNAGCSIESNGDQIIITSHSRPYNFDTVSTQPYPGFPTDAGPMLVAMSSVSKGTGVFIENIFDRRFGYIDEINRLGANIKTVGRVAIISGVKHLDAADVYAADLRGGAALAVALMASDGTALVKNTEYIDRGYDAFEHTFGNIGADIIRI